MHLDREFPTSMYCIFNIEYLQLMQRASLTHISADRPTKYSVNQLCKRLVSRPPNPMGFIHLTKNVMRNSKFLI